MHAQVPVGKVRDSSSRKMEKETHCVYLSSDDKTKKINHVPNDFKFPKSSGFTFNVKDLPQQKNGNLKTNYSKTILEKKVKQKPQDLEQTDEESEEEFSGLENVSIKNCF